MVGKDNPFSKDRIFYVVYDSIKPGMGTSTPLLYNGYRIGQIKKMTLDEKNHRIIGKLVVYSNMEIPKKSRVKMVSELLGGITLQLVLDKGILAEDGDTLQPDYGTDMVKMLNDRITPIAARADSLLASINSLINRPSLQKSIDELPALLNHFSETIASANKALSDITPGITTSVNNVAIFSESLKEYNNSIFKSIKSFERLAMQADSIQLTSIVASIESSIENIDLLLEGINSGKGSLGKLATDTELYDSLVKTNNTLQCFIEDIKSHPDKYLPLPWGKSKRKKAMQKSNQSPCPPN